MTSPEQEPSSPPEELYDEEYYTAHCGDRPYVKGDPEWTGFFDRVAENIVRSLAPRRVFDAGCAIGFLVEALWNRSVEAHGRDISRFAIDHVRPDVREWCSVGSITDPIEGSYDLIVCIEVLEHLVEADAELAIARMAAAAPRVLFSSSPVDFEEPTHINVRPPLYWITRFAEHGFRPVITYDATYICPWATLFEKTDEPAPEQELLAAAEIIRLRLISQQTQSELAKARADLMELGRLRGVEADLETTRLALVRQIRQAEQSQLRADNLERDLRAQLARASDAEALAHSLETSMFWRITAPARWAVGHLPPPVRRFLKRAAKMAALLVTLRIIGRLRERRALGHDDSGLDGVAEAESLGRGPASGRHDGDPRRRLEPINVFPSNEPVPAVTVITDSISPAEIADGAATAAIFSALLAEHLGGRLRVVTRARRGDAATVMDLLRRNGIGFDRIELLHAGVTDHREVPVGPSDIFVTTSWWATASTVRAIGHDRVVHLVQEDQRTLYPHGEERLRCAETLHDPALRLVVESELLLHHLGQGDGAIAGIRDRSTSFEPAFPDTLFFDDPAERNRSGKRTFLVTGRAHTPVDLRWRAVEAIDAAILEGTLDPRSWRFVFVGGEGRVPSLSGDPEVHHAEVSSLEHYSRLLRSAHVGMSLFEPWQPSRAALELAASGAVVVTDASAVDRQELAARSRNLIAADVSKYDLAEGIRRAVGMADDYQAVAANHSASGLERHWQKALAGAIEQVTAWVEF